MSHKPKIFHTAEAAVNYNLDQYRQMTPAERVEMIQVLREQWIKLNHLEEEYRESRTRLRTVCKIIKRS